MKQSLRKLLSTATITLALSLPSANAALFQFGPSDVLLSVQAYSGNGNDKNVFFNLGSTINLRDAVTTGTLGNIGSTLESVFGTNWYSRTDVRFGVYGNLNAGPNTGIGAVAAANGDPSRTTYLPVPVVSPGSSLAVVDVTPSALAFGGGAYSGIKTMVQSLDANADFSAVVNQLTQATLFQNSWSAYNPSGTGAAMTAFSPGSLENTFGQGAPVTWLDIQRVTTTTTGANPSQSPGIGTYVASIGITENGNIVAVPEPSTSLLGALAGALCLFRRRRA